MMSKTVFVTVGTTSFDSLIRVLDDRNVHLCLQNLGYDSLCLQIGRGVYEPTSYCDEKFSVTYYRFKDSLASDLTSSSLVISHAGAGSCMETLAAGKPLIVVINEDLMNNHQIELAQQLASDGHCMATVCRELPNLLEDRDELSKSLTNLKRFPRGKPELFASFIDNIMSV